MTHRSFKPWPHTGAVLAGGRSERMGEPKHDLLLPTGETMLARVAGALGELCHDVVIVGAIEPEACDLRIIPDRVEGQGPLGGLDALLASGIDDHYLVCPCDTPLVTAALLAKLTVPEGRQAVVFHVVGEASPRPLPIRIAASTAPHVSASLRAGRRALHRLLDELDPQVVTLDAEAADALRNVNTPEEYHALLRGRD